MHAVVVRVTMNDIAAVKSALPERIVPKVAANPEFVAGYWTAKAETGLGMFIFESEAAAEDEREFIASHGDKLPPMVTLEDVEVREVAAHAP